MINIDGMQANKLMEVTGEVWKNRDCAKSYGKEYNVSIKDMCVGGMGNDACHGDSGGPLMMKGPGTYFIHFIPYF